MRKSEITALVLILASFAIGALLYPYLPERTASHWDASGSVDGYMPKPLALLLMPLISSGLLVLFILIPRIDPLKENIAKFRKYYDGFVILIIAFLSYLYLLTIFWGMGARFSIIQLLSPAFAVLFYYCGILMENAKRNWFIGIRTPWTMSSGRVWRKTHRIGGKLFKAAGAIALLGVLLPSYAVLFVLVPVILVAAYTTAYSYFEYQQEK